MRRLGFLILFMLVLSLTVVSISADETYSQAAPAKLTLVPSAGFSVITVVGTGFFGGSITISWDGDPIPTVPSPLFTSDTQRGMFTAIISVPTPDEPGPHTVTARDQSGYSASAAFTVIDMIGPEGSPGEQGPPGPRGEPGPLVFQGHQVSRGLPVSKALPGHRVNRVPVQV